MYVSCIFIFVLCELHCMVDARREIHRILNGQLAALGQFPFAVAIFCADLKCIQCTGALLTTSKIITPADCFRVGPIENTFYAMAGDVFRIKGLREAPRFRQIREVAEIVRHPHEANQKPWYTNFAMLTVTDPFKLSERVATIPIAKKRLAELSTCLIMGFGSKDSKMAPVLLTGERLQYGHSIVDSSKCPNLRIRSDDKVYCISSTTINMTSGDIGGPLISANKPYEFYGTAVLNGMECDSCALFSDAVANKKWIINKLLDRNGTGGIIKKSIDSVKGEANRVFSKGGVEKSLHVRMYLAAAYFTLDVASKIFKCQSQAL